jgi:hypothetical protein
VPSFLRSVVKRPRSGGCTFALPTAPYPRALRIRLGEPSGSLVGLSALPTGRELEPALNGTMKPVPNLIHCYPY